MISNDVSFVFNDDYSWITGDGVADKFQDDIEEAFYISFFLSIININDWCRSRRCVNLRN